MNIPLFLRTISHLRIVQVFYQIKYRLIKPKFHNKICLQNTSNTNIETIIPKYECLKDNVFTFLNISDNFKSWNDTSHGMLWIYNLNYMDWLLQRDLSIEEGEKWIDKFIYDIQNNKVGLDPYPIALRGINWIKFFIFYPKCRNTERDNSLYSQYCLLEKKLEYHLLGNHLLEDSYSLLIGGIYFSDKNFINKACRFLKRELNEQVLKDGAHYEQSPMYHCILLDRLLDCYNFSFHNIRYNCQLELNDFLKEKAQLMLGHLESIIWDDKTIPLLNDSAFGIAPQPIEIFDYANRLNLQWTSISMKECGYRKFHNKYIEAIIDVGNIAASYQPGHSHSDTFNYELRINEIPFIVDTGISTYDKTSRRQLERSTIAHNTVSIKEYESNEVWGGFRVGRRAKVTIIKDIKNEVIALHNGFPLMVHQRNFSLKENDFEIIDTVSKVSHAISIIHFAPNVSVLEYDKNSVKTNLGDIYIENADNIEIIDGKISKTYNQFQSIKIILLHFTTKIKYTIKIK